MSYLTLREAYEKMMVDILLEKDHRQKMIKFGIPQDVADFLHEFDDKYSIWFANQFKNMEGYKQADDKLRWIRVNHGTDITSIRDWVRGVPNIQLKDYKFEDALRRAKDWHDSMESRKLESQETNKIIKKYDDGFYWVDLESNRCETEAGLMGHCASSGKADTLFSLRKYFPETNTIDGYVTIAVSPNKNTWYQAKGKKNSKPKPEYFPYIADILYSNNIYIYEGEYQSSHDFNVEDFKEYIEENRDKFENADDFLEKLKDNDLESKIERITNQYKFNHLHSYYEVYENEYVVADSGFTLKLNTKDYPNLGVLLKKDLDSREIRKTMEKIIETVADINHIYDLDRDYYSSEHFLSRSDDYTLEIPIYIKYDQSNCYYETEICYKHFLDMLKQIDDKLSRPNFMKEISQEFIDEMMDYGLIPDEEEWAKMGEEGKISRFLPEDPRQMKFKFAESFKKFFNS